MIGCHIPIRDALPLRLCAFAPLRLCAFARDGFHAKATRRKEKRVTKRRSLPLLRITSRSRTLFVPTPRTPSMRALPHLQRIICGRGQTLDYFALFVAQLVPGAQPPDATARALIASLHLDRSRS